MRLAVYCDYSYRIEDGRVYAELPFALFVQGLVAHFERVVVTGRLDPTPGRYPYSIENVTYVPQPHYESGANFGEVLRAIPAGARRFWRMLEDVDVVWILGPNPPQALTFALLTLLRRRRLVLGVRQLLPELIRHRRPGQRAVQLAAILLETAFRALGRFVPVVVVGPHLAQRYRRAASLHVLYVSLLHEADIVQAEEDNREYDGPELRALSVGRLDPEKNPLMLADVLRLLRRHDPRWRLDICGDGSLAASLAQRLAELGVADAASMLGYIPIDDGLWDLYRRSHALLHVSLTEGVPQVLFEAFAARLPVVATAVGGVPFLVGDAGWLIPPSDADAAATALAEVATNEPARSERVTRAAQAVRRHTLEAECARLAAFLDDSPEAGPGPGSKAADGRPRWLRRRARAQREAVPQRPADESRSVGQMHDR
jgi:glycosyltransferase involved in cell wall biosynthesis